MKNPNPDAMAVAARRLAGTALAVLVAMGMMLIQPPLAAAQAPDASGSVVRGEVRGAVTGSALAGSTVELRDSVGATVATVTDTAGAYRLVNVTPGRSTLRVRYVGHTPIEMDIVVPVGQDLVLDVMLPLFPVPLDPVTVETTNRVVAAIDSTAAGSPELGIAGSRALEASPGLTEMGLAEAARGIPGNEPADPGSVLYVRGATADLKLVYLDGAPVYAPFPLGGLMEPFAPGLLNRADIYLGGAPARYDGGLSYVMDLRTRAAASGTHLNVATDLLSARGSAEFGVADRFGIMAGARGIHPVASAGLLGDALPYAYREGLVRGDFRFGPSAGLSVTGFANEESVRMGQQESTDSVVRWGNRTGSLRFSGLFGRTEVEVTAARGEYDASLPFTGDDPMVADGGAMRTRFSADLARGGDVRLGYGFSVDHQAYRAVGTRPVAAAAPTVLDGSGNVVGAYLEASGRVVDRVRVRAGARIDRFSTTRRFAFAPRISATWLISDNASMHAAAGRYHQFLRPPDEVLLTGSESLTTSAIPLAVARSTHLTVGLDQNLGENVHLGIEGFYKEFSDVPGRLALDANASGVEFWVRRSAGNWVGWLGYSLAWVWSVPESRTGTETGEGDDGRIDFSGRHLLSAGFEASIRDRTSLVFGFAYGAGLPYSGIPLSQPDAPSRVGDIESVFTVASISVNSASRGGTETAPLLYSPDTPFLRLDVSISSHWDPELGGRRMRVEPYIKVLNGLGRRDALFYFVNDQQDDPRAIGTLPVLPIVGVSVGF